MHPLSLEFTAAAKIDRAAWDALCAECCASHLCLSDTFSLRGWSQWLAVEIFDRSAQARVGQAAIRLQGDKAQFMDSLVLLPAYRHAVGECLAEIIQRLPERVRTIRYGSPWNIQPAVTPQNAVAPGVEIIDHQHYVTDAIDLSHHSDRAGFLQSLGSSHRRNLKRAEAVREAVRCDTAHGLDCLRHLPQMNALRQSTYGRKRLQFGRMRSLASMAAKVLRYRRRAFVSLLHTQGRCYGGIFGVAHSSMAFYIHGGSLPNRTGLSHWQHLSLISECIERRRKYYVMGYALAQESGGAEVAAQREFKRRFHAAEFPGTMLTLRRVA